MTVSLLGRCGRTGMLGAVVSSSSPAVAARCIRVRAGVGAATSQNVTDPRLGPALLDALADGLAAPAALARVAGQAAHLEHRQLAVLDAAGATAARSGSHTLGCNATSAGAGCVAAGNLLADRDVVAAMVASFEATVELELGARLVAALAAAEAAGGEEGELRSAGLLVADRVDWPVADLRVDWHDEPVAELARLWEVWRPQLGDYVTRALEPAAAPSYGVPGDP